MEVGPAGRGRQILLCRVCFPLHLADHGPYPSHVPSRAPSLVHDPYLSHVLSPALSLVRRVPSPSHVREPHAGPLMVHQQLDLLLLPLLQLFPPFEK